LIRCDILCKPDPNTATGTRCPTKGYGQNLMQAQESRFRFVVDRILKGMTNFPAMGEKSAETFEDLCTGEAAIQKNTRRLNNMLHSASHARMQGLRVWLTTTIVRDTAPRSSRHNVIAPGSFSTPPDRRRGQTRSFTSGARARCSLHLAWSA